jgi:hypothetical protein
LNAEQHAHVVRKAASTALHYEACDAASAARRRDVSQFHATAIMQESSTPVPAADPQWILQHPDQCSTPHQPPVATAAQQLASPNSTPLSTYQSHSSPAVRMAASRAAQAQTARAAATTVVVMATSQAKLMQWKTGEEKDGKGFYWSTKLLVQQAWEQHNMSEDVHNYRTFKSAIHCLMVPIICAELLVSRAQFDAMPDAELIDKIDKRLKPTGPVDYLIRMRSIKMNHQS